MVDDTSKATVSRYNMNEANFMLLGQLQQEAFYLSNVKRNFTAAFDRWNSIRLIVESVFTDGEKTALDSIDKDFHKSLRLRIPKDLKDTKHMGGKKTEQELYIYNAFQIHKTEHLQLFIRELSMLLRRYKISMTDLDKKKKLG